MSVKVLTLTSSKLMQLNATAQPDGQEKEKPELVNNHAMANKMKVEI